MPDEPKNEEVATPLTQPIEPVSSASFTPAETSETVEPTPSMQQTPPVTVVSAFPSKKRRKGIIIGVIIAGALLLLSGATVSAYFLWYQNPNKVVSDAVIHAITAKTVSATSTLTLDYDDYTIKIEASGRNSLEANSTLAVKATIAIEGSEYVVDGEGVVSSEGDMYVKLNDAQKLVDSFEKQSGGEVSFDAFYTVIKKIDGNWIKISKEDLGDFSEDYEKAQKCFADISKSLDNDAAFRKTVQNETEKLYRDNQFLLIGNSLGSRTINGQASIGYILEADTVKADGFFTGLGETELGTKIKACDSDIVFEDIVDETNKTDDTSKSETQIWVSRFGHTLTEINSKGETDEGSGTFVINPVFNKNEAVAVPTNSISLAELKADIEAAYEDLFTSYDYPTAPADDTMVNYN